MSNVLLTTWTDDDDADVLYSYQIVKEEVTLFDEDGDEDSDTEYVVYRELSPLRYKKCGKYDTFLEAVKGLHVAMKNEIYEDA
jgi:hypothetical protein